MTQIINGNYKNYLKRKAVFAILEITKACIHQAMCSVLLIH